MILPASSALALASALAICGCSSAEQTDSGPSDADQLVGVNVGSKENVCPHFESAFVLPQTLAPKEISTIDVRATDPDGKDSALQYSWSATSGSLMVLDQPTTKYQCDKTGQQVLTVITSDPQGCRRALNIEISCVD